MRFYRVSRSTEGGNSAGFEFFTSKIDAERAARQWIENNPGESSWVDPIDVNATKQGILRCLNIHASHPDNG